MLEKDLSGKLPNLKPLEVFTYEFAVLETINKSEGIRVPWRRWSKIFDNRLRRGQAAIFCFNQHGRAVGYIWIALVPEKERGLGLKIVPGPDDSYGFDLYVDPQFRSHSIAFHLLTQWLQHSLACDKQTAFGYVTVSNKQMLLATRLAFGFKITKRLYSLQFFNRFGVLLSTKHLN